MQITINTNSYFVFDLDDTLYAEIDFLQSAYQHIASILSPVNASALYQQMLQRYNNKEDVFKWLINVYPGCEMQWLLHEYRHHTPAIKLNEAALEILQKLKKYNAPCGLITDGRSITQRNKLKALHIEDAFDDIIISEEFGSEKPDERNYTFFTKKYPGKHFYFFGDNIRKDFIVPEKLGWNSFCLQDAGKHIHPQHHTTTQTMYKIIASFSQLELVKE